MTGRTFAGSVTLALGMMLSGTPGLSQSQPPTEGPAVGRDTRLVSAGVIPRSHRTNDCRTRVAVSPSRPAAAMVSAAHAGTTAVAAPACAARAGRRPDTWMQAVARVRQPAWPPTPDLAARAVEANDGVHVRVPVMCCLPALGGVPAVALDSKGNLWAFQRADAGKPQLFKFDPNHKLILQVGPDVIGYQDKAHGMAVDAEDNVWITAANGATVMKLGPEGKLLLTIGERGRRGDWNEAKATTASLAAGDDRLRAER